MGRPLPGLETRIVDGELQLRAASSPTFFDRYLDGERFEGEWWPTGDRVREDGDGYLWFEGRGDDLILSSGYRIGPFEVESALISHPAVAEAAAVAAPDPERGSVVRAVVVLRDGSEPSEELARELQEHVKAQTAPYKYPRIVEFAERAAEDRQRQDQAGGAARAARLKRRWTRSTASGSRADRGPAGAVPQPDRRLGRDLQAGGEGDARTASPPPSRRTTPGPSTSTAARAAGSGTSTATNTSTSTTASA